MGRRNVVEVMKSTSQLHKPQLNFIYASLATKRRVTEVTNLKDNRSTVENVAEII